MTEPEPIGDPPIDQEPLQEVDQPQPKMDGAEVALAYLTHARNVIDVAIAHVSLFVPPGRHGISEVHDHVTSRADAMITERLES